MNKPRPQDGAHAFLFLPELQPQIFQYLLVETQSGEGMVPEDDQHDLLNIALTCKAFTDSAMKIKWRSLVGLRALFFTIFDHKVSYMGLDCIHAAD